MISKLNFKQYTLRRETQQFLDQSVDGWKKVSAPPNTFFNLERRNYDKKTIFEQRMENEIIIKNETQVSVDAIEKYFKGLYTSASNATQEEYDSFIQGLCLPKLSDEERDELEGLLTYDDRYVQD